MKTSSNVGAEIYDTTTPKWFDFHLSMLPIIFPRTEMFSLQLLNTLYICTYIYIYICISFSYLCVSVRGFIGIVFVLLLDKESWVFLQMIYFNKICNI